MGSGSPQKRQALDLSGQTADVLGTRLQPQRLERRKRWQRGGNGYQGSARRSREGLSSSLGSQIHQASFRKAAQQLAKGGFQEVPPRSPGCLITAEGCLSFLRGQDSGDV